MESTTSDINENGSQKLEQDTEKVNENGEQGQDNIKETENKNLGDEVARAVGEVALVGEHHDSPCPMVVKDTPVPSHSDNCPVETDAKDNDLLKTNTDTTPVGKNTQLEKSPQTSPSPLVSLDPDKGLVNPMVESLVEKSKVSSLQASSDLSTNDRGFAKVGKDTPVDQGKTALLPDGKLLGDTVEGPIQPDTEISIEQDKASTEPDTKSLGDNNKCADMPAVETLKENDKGTGEVDTINSADHEKGPAEPHIETSTDDDKGPNVPGCETQSKQENGPSKPDMETSTNLEKASNMPASDTSMDSDKRPDVLATGTSSVHDKGSADIPATQTSSDHDKGVTELEAETVEDMKDEVPDSKVVSVDAEHATDVEKKDNSEAAQRKDGDNESGLIKHDDSEPGTPHVASSDFKSKEERGGDLNNGVHKIDSKPPTFDGTMNSKQSFLLDDMSEGNESGTEEEQSAFMKELENFFRERSMEFKPPKFYGEGLNCLKLWRAVTRLGGYDKVTTCKLWRQVGESFRPPKTCTTVSWTFRGFYEKALLEYERHKVNGGELHIPLASHSEVMNIDNQASGSGRARRDAAARAMQGWHSQRLLGNGEVSDPIIKDKSSVPQQKREKQSGTPGLLKRKRPPSTEHAAKTARTQVSKPQFDVTVVDLGPPADWVKINVQRTKDCFEVYALVPGLLREEVRVQSDPAGRLVISGEPENPDNLWGATPFKKVVSLPARIDPHHTSAVVTLNGQLFVRVPLELSD